MHKQLILAAVSWIDNLALSVQTICVSSWTLSVQFFVLGPWMNNTFFLVGPGCTNCLFEQLGPGCTSTILLSRWALDVPIVYFISWVPDSQGTSYCIILPNSDTAEVVLPRLQGSELLRKWDTLTV